MADQQNPFGQSVAQGTTLATQNVSAPIGAFGGLVGQAMSQAGGAMQSAGGYTVNLAQRIQQRRDASDIMGAMTKAQKSLQDAWYNPETGYARRTGSSARGVHEAVAADIKRIGDEALLGIKSKEARELFQIRFGTEAMRWEGKAAEWEMHHMDVGHKDEAMDAARVAAAEMEADPDPENLGSDVDKYIGTVLATFDNSPFGKEVAESGAAILIAGTLGGLQNARDYDGAEKLLGDKKNADLLAKSGYDVGKIRKSITESKEKNQAFELGKSIAGKSMSAKFDIFEEMGLSPEQQNEALRVANLKEAGDREAHNMYQQDLSEDFQGVLAQHKRDILKDPTKAALSFDDVFAGMMDKFNQLDGDLQLMLVNTFENMSASILKKGASAKGTYNFEGVPGEITFDQFVTQAEQLSLTNEGVSQLKTMLDPANITKYNLTGMMDDDQARTRLFSLQKTLMDNGWKTIEAKNLSEDAKTSLWVSDAIKGAMGAVETAYIATGATSGKEGTKNKDFIINSVKQNIVDWAKLEKARTGKDPAQADIEKRAMNQLLFMSSQHARTQSTNAKMSTMHLEEFGNSKINTFEMSEGQRAQWVNFTEAYFAWQQANPDRGVDGDELMDVFTEYVGTGDIDAAVKKRESAKGMFDKAGDVLGRIFEAGKYRESIP